MRLPPPPLLSVAAPLFDSLSPLLDTGPDAATLKIDGSAAACGAALNEKPPKAAAPSAGAGAGALPSPKRKEKAPAPPAVEAGAGAEDAGASFVVVEEEVGAGRGCGAASAADAIASAAGAGAAAEPPSPPPLTRPSSRGPGPLTSPPTRLSVRCRRRGAPSFELAPRSAGALGWDAVAAGVAEGSTVCRRREPLASSSVAAWLPVAVAAPRLLSPPPSTSRRAGVAAASRPLATSDGRPRPDVTSKAPLPPSALAAACAYGRAKLAAIVSSSVVDARRGGAAVALLSPAAPMELRPPVGWKRTASDRPKACCCRPFCRAAARKLALNESRMSS